MVWSGIFMQEPTGGLCPVSKGLPSPNVTPCSHLMFRVDGERRAPYIPCVLGGLTY